MSDFQEQNVEQAVGEANTESHTTSERRAFIKGAAIAAGAAATLGVANSATAATMPQSATATSSYGEHRGLMSATIDRTAKVNIQDVHRMVEQMLDIAGCPTCGLNGFDIRLGLDQVVKLDTEVLANATFHM